MATHESSRDTTDVLVPYVPRLLIEWLRDSNEQRYRSIEGTLAFVDISGFTKMTERLATKGKVGAEEMSDTLNKCFSDLLSVAYDYGAGLVKWGGDAVLLLFEGDDHAARACRGAFEMQREIRTIGRLRTTAGRVALRMSVGIHTGSFEFFLVGDVHRELVISGPAATETVVMEQIAEAGEIAVSAATASLLDPHVLGAAKGEAILLKRPPDVSVSRAAPVGSVDAAAVANCLPLAIRNHLLLEQGEAEHRIITVAFIEFGGVQGLLAEHGVEALTDALDECMTTVQRETARHNVTFFETDINSDGGKIMLVAGAPTTSGNDQERMLRAVRAIVDAGVQLPLRVGVNCGRVFAGDFGPPFRRTYSVKGDAVNLAARVMGKAAVGEILATNQVLAGSSATFETEELEPFRVKGKAQPVRAARVGEHRQADETTADAERLVGRERELEVLLGALRSADDWEGRAVEVVGEPGIGKSRLLDELRRRTREAIVLTAVCDEYEAATPYAPFRNLLCKLLDLDPAGGSHEGGRRLAEQVGEVAPHLVPWVPFLAAILDVEAAPTPETESLDEKFRKERLEEVVRELLGIVLSGPTLLVFEDVHWLDEASSDLLAALVVGIELRPWLIVVTRREHAGALRVADRERVDTLHLEPLDDDAAATLLDAATEDLPLPPHHVATLKERAGGNPLFLQELLTAAREAGSVDALPDSIEAVLAERIDRLAPRDKTILRYAAVLGLRFDSELLAAALPEEAGAPDDGVWLRLAALVAPDGRIAFRFRHALIRDAAYEGLPYRRRRDVHARVGATIEQRARNPEDDAELLSLHFFHAQRFEEAWRYSLIAGERAAAIYANADAALLYERALSAARGLPDLPPLDVARASEALGDVRVRLGEFERAGSAYRASRSVATDGAAEEARLMLKEALIPWRLGRYPPTVRWLRRASRVLEGEAGAEAGAERARAYAWLGGLRLRQGKALEAIEWCRRAIEEATEAGADEPLAHAYYVLDGAYFALDRPEEAVNSQRALAIYEELGNLGEQGGILNNLGMFACLQGRWTEGTELFRRAEEAWDRAGDRFSAAVATANRGEILSDQGRLDEAEPLLRGALRVARASHGAFLIGAIASVYGRLKARAGEFDDAHELLAEGRAANERVGAREQLALTEARRAECFLLERRGREAHDLAVETLDVARSQEASSELLPMLHRIRGSALVQLGRLAEGEEGLTESVQLARARGADYDSALALDALVALWEFDEHREVLEIERDEIFARLDVVSVPAVSLRPSLRVSASAKTSGSIRDRCAR